MMKGWFSKALRRAQAGEDIETVTAEFRDALPDGALDAGYVGGEGDNETHVHLHLPGGGGGGSGSGMARTPDDGEEEMHGTGAGLSDEAFAQLVARVDQIEQTLQELLGNEEEEVELEGDNPDGTRDARRFVMRRGKKLTRDESEVPERKPEMIGETDLPGIEDLNKRTGDSVAQEPLWHQTIAAAEILLPGIRVPTFDANHTSVLTAKRLCAFRRYVLDQVFEQDPLKPVIRSFVGDGAAGRNALKRLPCETVKACFNLSTDAMKSHNNYGTTRSNAATSDNNTARTMPMSLGEMNRMHREHWAKNTNGAVR